MKFVQDIIIRPLITENSMDMIAERKYSFEVAKDATKPEIAKAVEEMFKVDVESAKSWIVKGAQPTETVKSILKKSGVID